jgi:hypothetical protein
MQVQSNHTLPLIFTLIDVCDTLIECDSVLKLDMHLILDIVVNDDEQDSQCGGEGWDGLPPNFSGKSAKFFLLSVCKTFLLSAKLSR